MEADFLRQYGCWDPSRDPDGTPVGWGTFLHRLGALHPASSVLALRLAGDAPSEDGAVPEEEGWRAALAAHLGEPYTPLRPMDLSEYITRVPRED